MKKVIFRLSIVVVLIFTCSCANLANIISIGKPSGVKVLVQGPPYHGANGIYFDSKDRLYIASAWSSEIVIMDPDTGRILETRGSDEGIIFPDDLTFGPDGSLYWTAISIGEVWRLSPDGVKSKQMVKPGVNPITFSNDGRLFVALDFQGDALYELDPNLVDPPRLIAENLGWLNGMDWGPDGLLYGPIWTKGKVVKIDVDTGKITTAVRGFAIPAAVKFDSKGRLHVIEFKTGNVTRVNIKTGRKEVIATLPPGLDNLAFDSHDRLFISHAQDGSIFEVLENGKVRVVRQGGMMLPTGVAVMPRSDGESVFVADLYALREFDGMTGKEINADRHWIGMHGSIVASNTVSRAGNKLFLTPNVFYGNVIQVWNPKSHRLIREYKSFDSTLTTIEFQGDIIVVEPGDNRVVRANARNAAKRVTIVDGLELPMGLAATDDDVWVSDSGAGKVLQIIADGKVLKDPVTVAADLKSPGGLAIASNGNLLVVEAKAGRLSAINLETGQVNTIARGLDIGSSITPLLLHGVAVGPSGAIYVTGDKANILYRIEPK